MSTTCYIGIENRNMSVDAIYCHYDGYIDGVGRTLFDNYKDVNKIKELISLGSISTLGKVTEFKQDSRYSWTVAENGYTMAYHRDRGENWEDTKTLHFNSNWTFISEVRNDVDYIYLFVDNEWWAMRSDDIGLNKLYHLL